MLETVKERLKLFGCAVADEDIWVLQFIISKVENTVKDSCNANEVPDGLFQTAVDMVVGEYLLGKKNTGGLTDFDLEIAIKTVQEGDTTTTFDSEGSMTAEQRLDALIAHLRAPNKSLWSRYRRLSW